MEIMLLFIKFCLTINLSLSLSLPPSLSLSLPAVMDMTGQGLAGPGLTTQGLVGQGFDPSEFPLLSLGGRARHEGMGMLGAAGLPTRPPFAVGPQLSKPPENAPGFQMHSEDFPALPGSATHKTSGERECVYAYVCLCVCASCFSPIPQNRPISLKTAATIRWS